MEQATEKERKKATSSYSLQKYKGTTTRYTYPGCGDRHSFVYHMDEQDTPLHPPIGRCNHESNCEHHYTPKQYSREHPECHAINDFFSGGRRVEQKPRQVSQPGTIGYIPPHCMEKSESVYSDSFRFITSLLTSYYDDKVKEMLKRLLKEYRLGATRDGAVIFW